MLEKKVISIDLDETMGDFRGITPYFANSRDEVRISRFPVIRQDLLATLTDLLMQDMLIAVSSGRRIISLLAALEESDIIYSVDRPFGRDELDYAPRRGGKDYRKVIEHFGLTEKRTLSDLIIIADDEDVDAPTTTSGTVFVCQPEGYLTTARIWQYILNELLEKGGGSFNQGFVELFSCGQQAARMPLLSPSYSPSKVKRYELQPGNIELYLQMRSSKESNIVTPTIVPILR